jgi:hypothetical protein
LKLPSATYRAQEKAARRRKPEGLWSFMETMFRRVLEWNVQLGVSKRQLPDVIGDWELLVFFLQWRFGRRGARWISGN